MNRGGRMFLASSRLGPEAPIDDRDALALMDAVQLAAAATADLRGPEGRRLGEAEIVAESQHRVRLDNDREVDSNTLPKEEPTFNAGLLAAVTLLDDVPALLEPDCDDEPVAMHDRAAQAIAAVLVPAYRHTVEEPGAGSVTLDRETIGGRFGNAVAEYVEAIDAAARGLLPCGGGVSHVALDPHLHDAVAATLASRLRLALRSAGEGLFGIERDRHDQPLLEGYRNGALGRLYGVRDERAYLEPYAVAVLSSLRMDGVAPGLREKIACQLLLPTRAVVAGHAEPGCLVGKHGAIPVYQNMLDLPRLGFQVARPFAAVLGSYFELARYAERSRRRDGEPLVVHALRVAGSLRRNLGRVTGTLWQASILHDYIEDNIWDRGFHSTIFRRVGLPALVAVELSDPERRGIDDVEKARKFEDRGSSPIPECAGTLYAGMLERLSEEDFLNAVLRPANPDHPYTVEAALLKIADFMDTMGSGLRHADRMVRDGWGQSGKRIGVHLYKDSIIRPLLRRLADEREVLTERNGLSVGDLLVAYGRRSLEYTRQNVKIACAERGVTETRALIEAFFDPGIDTAALAEEWAPRLGPVRAPHDPAMAVSPERLLGPYRESALEIRATTDRLAAG